MCHAAIAAAVEAPSMLTQSIDPRAGLKRQSLGHCEKGTTRLRESQRLPVRATVGLSPTHSRFSGQRRD